MLGLSGTDWYFQDEEGEASGGGLRPLPHLRPHVLPGPPEKDLRSAHREHLRVYICRGGDTLRPALEVKSDNVILKERFCHVFCASKLNRLFTEVSYRLKVGLITQLIIMQG